MKEFSIEEKFVYMVVKRSLDLICSFVLLVLFMKGFQRDLSLIASIWKDV